MSKKMVLPNGKIMTGIPDDASLTDIAKNAVKNGYASPEDFSAYPDIYSQLPHVQQNAPVNTVGQSTGAAQNAKNHAHELSLSGWASDPENINTMMHATTNQYRLPTENEVEGRKEALNAGLAMAAFMLPPVAALADSGVIGSTVAGAVTQSAANAATGDDIAGGAKSGALGGVLGGVAGKLAGAVLSRFSPHAAAIIAGHTASDAATDAALNMATATGTPEGAKITKEIISDVKPDPDATITDDLKAGDADESRKIAETEIGKEAKAVTASGIREKIADIVLSNNGENKVLPETPEVRVKAVDVPAIVEQHAEKLKDLERKGQDAYTWLLLHSYLIKPLTKKNEIEGYIAKSPAEALLYANSVTSQHGMNPEAHLYFTHPAERGMKELTPYSLPIARVMELSPKMRKLVPQMWTEFDNNPDLVAAVMAEVAAQKKLADTALSDAYKALPKLITSELSKDMFDGKAGNLLARGLPEAFGYQLPAFNALPRAAQAFLRKAQSDAARAAIDGKLSYIKQLSHDLDMQELDLQNQADTAHTKRMRTAVTEAKSTITDVINNLTLIRNGKKWKELEGTQLGYLMAQEAYHGLDLSSDRVIDVRNMASLLPKVDGAGNGGGLVAGAALMSSPIGSLLAGAAVTSGIKTAEKIKADELLMQILSAANEIDKNNTPKWVPTKK